MRRVAAIGSSLLLMFGIASAEEGKDSAVAELEVAGAWSLAARELGVDPRWFRFELREQGVQRVTIGYSEMRAASLRNGRSPFHVDGTHASLGDALYRVDATTGRKRVTLGFHRTLDAAWSIDADLRREVRRGARVRALMSGITGGNSRAVLFPVPVDDVTDVVDFRLSRGNQHSQFSIAWHGANYRNQLDSFSWAVPFAAHPAWAPGTGYPGAIGRIALEPSNHFHQVTIAGALHPGQGARISGDFAYGRMRQDEAFLPYTSNAGLVVSDPLPRASLDGRIDSLVGNLRAAWQATPRTHVNATLRYEALENHTEQARWAYVAADSQDQRAALAARINLPRGHRTQRAGLAVSHRLGRSTRLMAGWSHRDVRREFAESRGAREHTVRVGLRGRIDSVAFSADYRRSDRDARAYDGRVPYVAGRVPGTVAETAFENHPLLRRHNLTDRQREQYALRADWSASTRLSVGFTAQRAEDRYDDAFFGLNRGRVRHLGLDAGYRVSERVQLNGWAARDRFLTGQRGRAFTVTPGTADDPDRNWLFRGRDRVDSAGFSIRGGLGDARGIELGFDLVRSHARSEFETITGPALSSAPLPIVQSRVDGYTMHVTVPFGAMRSLRVALDHERVRGQDFATDGILPDTLANVLTLGEGTPRYSMTWLSLRYQHRF